MRDNPTYYAIIPANVRYDKRLRPNEKLLYGEITALANKTGECWASNNYFAELYQVKPQAVSKWISDLAEYGYITISYTYRDQTMEIESRTIKLALTNDSEVLTKKEEVLTKKDNEDDGGINKKSDWYKQKKNGNNLNINTTSRVLKNNTADADFDSLWSLYPRKEGKKQALTAYKKAIKAGVSVETIRKGIEAYISYIQREKVKPQYIKMGSTWFNGECWNDDYGQHIVGMYNDHELDDVFGGV